MNIRLVENEIKIDEADLEKLGEKLGGEGMNREGMERKGGMAVRRISRKTIGNWPR